MSHVQYIIDLYSAVQVIITTRQDCFSNSFHGSPVPSTKLLPHLCLLWKSAILLPFKLPGAFFGTCPINRQNSCVACCVTSHEQEASVAGWLVITKTDTATTRCNEPPTRSGQACLPALATGHSVISRRLRRWIIISQNLCPTPRQKCQSVFCLVHS